MAFSWRCCSAFSAAMAAVACAIAPSSSAVSSARRASASRSASMRARRSWISRLVSRMPRASFGCPPVTRCAPRNTSPAIVATGTDAAALARRTARVAVGDPRVADRAGEWRRRTDRSRARPTTASIRPSRRRRRAVEPPEPRLTVGNQEAAPARAAASRTSSNPASACSGRSTMMCCRRSPRHASTARS